MKIIWRPWQSADAAALRDILNNPRILKNLGDGVPYPYTEADAAAYIEQMQRADAQEVFSYAVLVDGTPVGNIGAFRGKGMHARTAELGYYLAEAYWGRGVMTEAVRRLCRELFAKTDLVRIYAEVFWENSASRRVLEKAGFRQEGCLQKSIVKDGRVRDVALYAYTRAQAGCVLETERLFLREMTMADFDSLYTVLADSDIMQHYPYTFDEARVRNWIRKNIERYQTFGFGLWAVCLRETGEMIGDCGVSMQNIDGQILPEIGYHIAKAHQRKEYAKEAARGCRDWVFAHTPFLAVYSYMKQANLASSATARANGMQLVREFTDGEGERSEAYRINRADWLRICGRK